VVYESNTAHTSVLSNTSLNAGVIQNEVRALASALIKINNYVRRVKKVTRRNAQG
jgi:hypothetical protein